MIIVKLIGGLGNQMFQYALGRRLSVDRNVPLKLDISWYSKDSPRQYSLNVFDIQASIASKEEVEQFIPSSLSMIKKRAYYFLQNHVPYRFRKVITEPRFSFNPNILNKTPNNAYLIGYWQSEKYFSEISEIIKSDFRIASAVSSAYLYWEDRINSQLSASVHIRRGDYLADKNYLGKFYKCPVEYFKRSMDLLRDQFSNIHFYIFSDDIEWAKNAFNDNPSFLFVENKGYLKDHEEIMLMSLCNHHVISNSTYSWWGAWLGSYSSKLVLTPCKWFSDRILHSQSSDLIPSNWLKIEAE